MSRFDDPIDDLINLLVKTDTFFYINTKNSSISLPVLQQPLTKHSLIFYSALMHFMFIIQSCEILEASVDSTFFSQSLHQICDPRKCYQYDNHCCCIKPSVGKQNLHIINKAFSKLRSRQGLYLSIVLFVYFLMTTILNCLILAG